MIFLIILAYFLEYTRRMTRSLAGSQEPRAPTTIALTLALQPSTDNSAASSLYLSSLIFLASYRADVSLSKGQVMPIIRMSLFFITGIRSGRQLALSTTWSSPSKDHLPRAAFLIISTITLWHFLYRVLWTMQWLRTWDRVSSLGHFLHFLFVWTRAWL